MFEPGTICRSKDAILKCEQEEEGRICRVMNVLPEARWRTRGVPEYKVELIALPVTAFRRHGELVPVAPHDFANVLGESRQRDSGLRGA